MATDRRSPRPPDDQNAANDAAHAGAESDAPRRDTSRRRFLGFLIAAPTVVAAAQLGLQAANPEEADASIPSLPEPADLYDLGDLLTDAARPTSNLITVQINKDGTASFSMPRSEVGQGITTSTAMLIAEELDLPLNKVHITLADARPELIFNQLTGGSNTTYATYTPVRVAAAIARQRLLEVAALELNDTVTNLTSRDGVISAPSGKTVTYAALATKAASLQNKQISAVLKPQSDFTIIGTPQNRIDALEAVTGRKKFTMDLAVPNAKPTMVCRPPTIKAKPISVANLAEVKKMPGITDVAMISTGVAVRGETFGQCIDAVRALKVTWSKGPDDGKSDDTILQELKKAEVPLIAPPLNLLAKTLDANFTFYFASNSALESNCAIADVRSDRAEIWAGLKSPITAQAEIAKLLGLPQTAVKTHVIDGGGSFGRKLFFDAALEAAEASKKFGKPVKLMWHRTDDFRHGRVHPMCTSRVRVNYAANNVISYEQRHTSVSTDFTHGLGEIITAMASKLPGGNFFGFSETVFELTANVSYNFGVTTQLLNEVNMDFHTGSMRNVYSPNVCTAQELIVDRLAAEMGKDPYQFRREFLKNDRSRAVLDKVAKVGNWGRSMPAGTAQGIAFHAEYHGVNAALVEIDCRPETVNRQIRDAYTGPRVTKIVFAVDVGLPVNPRGLEAQMMGGINDGIALALTSSVHLKDGYFLEGSWDNYWYTRQWNTPPEMQVIVMPPTTGKPGGAGEFGVAATMAAVACAFGRATGSMPTSFPINHNLPLGFTPLPTVPPIPQSPTDGLNNAD